MFCLLTALSFTGRHRLSRTGAVDPAERISSRGKRLGQAIAFGQRLPTLSTGENSASVQPTSDSDAAPSPGWDPSSSFLSLRRGPRPGGPREGLSGLEGGSGPPLQLLTSSASLGTRKPSARSNGPPPARSTFSRTAQLAPASSMPSIEDHSFEQMASPDDPEPPKTPGDSSPASGTRSKHNSRPGSAGSALALKHVNGSQPPKLTRNGSVKSSISVETSRRERPRNRSISSMASIDSAAVRPRGSSLAHLSEQGSSRTTVARPPFPQRSSSVKGSRPASPQMSRPLSMASAESPLSPGLDKWREYVLRAEQDGTTHSPNSISSRDVSFPLNQDSIDQEKESVEDLAGPETISISPAGSTSPFEKPALPQRNPLRQQRRSVVASSTSVGHGQKLGPGLGFPSTLSTSTSAMDMRSVSDSMSRPQRDDVSQRRLSASEVTNDIHSLRSKFGVTNKSQTSLASQGAETMSIKSKGRKWNPLKDVFSDGEDLGGSGFAKSMKFRSKKMTKNKDAQQLFARHMRTDSNVSATSTQASPVSRSREGVASMKTRPSQMTLQEQQDKAERNELDRVNIMRELVETEKSYASDLAVVRDIYLARARTKLFSTSPGTHSPSSFGNNTPPMQGSYFGSPRAIHRGRIPSSSAGVAHLRQQSNDSAGLLDSPYQPPFHSPLWDSSDPGNRSSMYTVASSTGSMTADSANLSSLAPATLSPQMSNSLSYSASLAQSASSDTLGTASQPASINGHDVVGPRSPPSFISHAVGSREAPFSAADIRVIFAHLEDCASLADVMAQHLEEKTSSLKVHESGPVGQQLADFFLAIVGRC